MSLFKNASPEYIWLGASDKAGRTLPYERDAIPQHVPLMYIFAKKGNPDKKFLTGAKAAAMYDPETFNPDGKYYTHTTELATAMFGAANSCSMKRVVPNDAAHSSLVLYVDVLPTQVPNYQRTGAGDKIANGSGTGFLTDVTTPTIAGVKVKFITEVVDMTTSIGLLPTKTGTMLVGGVHSTMYPIFEHRSSFAGDHYNNIGYSIQSMTADQLDDAVVTATKALTYDLSLVERAGAGAAPTILASLFGSPAVQFTLKAGTKHPLTTVKLDYKSVFEYNWFNETDPLMPVRYNDYQSIYNYSANTDTVLALIMANEKTHINVNNLAWFDFTTTDATALDSETYLIDIFSGHSSSGKDYFTVEMDGTAPTLAAGQKEVHVSKATPLFLSGGSDGTMSNSVFEALVLVELAKYLDPNSQVIDNATNVETHVYDSGFSLPVKKAMFNLIALRKDTVAVVGTHIHNPGGGVAPLADERAMAVLLKTSAKLFPESDFFGTPVARAVICAGAYKLYSSLTGDYYSSVFELAIKSARMMSAGNYHWKSAFNFDHGSNAILKYGFDYQPKFIPAGIKPTLWNDGLVWAQPRDLETYFIPAVQTVYDDDTSPLNNWITVCALASLNRIASDSWREFTGTSTMSDAEFKDAVLNYLVDRLNGIFDGLVVVIPEVIIDKDDALRGYSWHVMFQLYAGNMKTKMISYTEVYRLSSL